MLVFGRPCQESNTKVFSKCQAPLLMAITIRTSTVRTLATIVTQQAFPFRDSVSRTKVRFSGEPPPGRDAEDAVVPGHEAVPCGRRAVSLELPRPKLFRLRSRAL
ncbi:hypothetical protein PSTG_16211 [Puccinia striiformis f. sp. tritici PST-78]|uniref:Uncharacterized protein n=1 Tax=Puccinia striiformis f. sp. tritici PST-78 TaxID=1165861 RepID=A0A0L0UTI9_9BASI|nr:hypothetical protein PSTG_16211 [Puccinia striiformis f. sp. tritici PST-78]